MRWLSAAAILFALTTAAAFLQPPKLDPYQQLQPLQAGWWLHPLEKNAFQRLPQLEASIDGLANPPGTNLLWAVGSRNLVLKSKDAGRTWAQISLSIRDAKPVEPDISFHDVFFRDSAHGWIAGSRGTLLLTTNGGKTWKRSSSLSRAPSPDLYNVYFTSLKEGLAVGNGIFRSINGGLDWFLSEFGDKDTWLRLGFNSQNTLWVFGDNKIGVSTNGGAYWTISRAPTSSSEGLINLFFLNARLGWALGREGSFFVTENGGKNWIKRARLSPGGTYYYSLSFVDSEHGWLFGFGNPLTTTDGGRSWAPDPNLTASDGVDRALFVDKRRGWLTGNNILSTTDGGLRWVKSMRSYQVPLAVTWFNEQRALAADSAGNILRTENSGQSWDANKVARTSLTDVHFVNRNIAWAVGLKGLMLKSTNGGAAWTLQSSGIQDDFSNVYFADKRYGWAVAGRMLLRTEDGGNVWKKIQMDAPLEEVRFSSPSNGIGLRSSILSPFIAGTTNGGQTWKAYDGVPQTRTDCQLVDPTRVFCWSFGELGFTANAGASWEARTYPAGRGKLKGIHFLSDARTGWAFDQASQVYATTDSGITWTPRKKLPVTLTKIQFASAKTGSAIGQEGSIFVTHDGGKTWENGRRHRIYPAPWYYLSLLLVLGFTWMGLRRRQPLAEQLSIADVLTSDRPVDASQHDALNLDPLAQALSRFLRNESTQPPLTIAVTGEWGTGKSSLMNLLRDDLRRHGFHPVSFNAWHHQKEEHLLASLLENIRRQAIPPPWSRGGLAFRLRLLWIRGKRSWFLASLALFAIAVYTGLYLADPSSLSDRMAEIKRGADKLAPWFGEDERDVGGGPIAPGITWLLGLGAVAETLRRGLRSFGIRPAQLLATASGSLKLSALEQQLGFREQFSREFSDVTRALQPRSMVILIDDLDRCRPENVSEILEAVNFLVSSGECVIVMGLDIDRVERAIGLAFRDVATEMLDRSSTPHAGHIVIPGDSLGERGMGAGAPGGNPEDEELKLRRQRFARQYLEKLINIEVPVPRSNAEEFAKLFDVLNKEGWKPTPVAAFILKAADITRRWSPALLALALLGAGLWVGLAAQRPAQTRQPVAAADPAPTPTISSLPGKLSTVAPSPPPAIQGESHLYPAKPGRRSPAFLALPLGLMALLMIWRAIKAQEDIVRDSPQFVDALRTWTPFLFSKRNNPRSAKRFLNRVRYYAMFQRPYIPPVSPLQRLLIRLKLLRARDTLDPAVSIPEAILVALSAIQHCEREWLSDKTLYTDFVKHLRQEGVPESLLEHREEFQRWGSLEPYRESFERISAGIRVT